MAEKSLILENTSICANRDNYEPTCWIHKKPCHSMVAVVYPMHLRSKPIHQPLLWHQISLVWLTWMMKIFISSLLKIPRASGQEMLPDRPQEAPMFIIWIILISCLLFCEILKIIYAEVRSLPSHFRRISSFFQLPMFVIVLVALTFVTITMVPPCVTVQTI